MASTTCRIVDFEDYREVIHGIRHRVFTLEQGVDGRIDFDGLDPDAVQVVVYDGHEPVGTGRMLADGHIGRIAVLADYRGRGLGTVVVTTLIDHARRHGFGRVYLGAQVRAVPFYEKLGFVRDGDDYMEADILHTPMALPLS